MMSKGKNISISFIFCTLVILYLRIKYIEPAEDMVWFALETSIVPIFTSMINFISDSSPLLIPAILILGLVVLMFRLRDIVDMFETVGDIIRSFLRLL